MFEKLIETISQLKNSPEIKKIIDELNITEEDVKDLESKFHEQIIQCKELLKDLSAKIREDLEPEQEVGPCINPCSEIKDCCKIDFSLKIIYEESKKYHSLSELAYVFSLYCGKTIIPAKEQRIQTCNNPESITEHNQCSSFDLSEKEIEAELIKSGWTQIWVDKNYLSSIWRKSLFMSKDTKKAYSKLNICHMSHQQLVSCSK